MVSNSKRVKGMKDAIAQAVYADKTMPKPPPRAAPMLLEIECGMPVMSKKLHGQLHTGRPDSDNILKAVKDAWSTPACLMMTAESWRPKRSKHTRHTPASS